MAAQSSMSRGWRTATRGHATEYANRPGSIFALAFLRGGLFTTAPMAIGVMSVGESSHVSGMCLAGEKRFLIVVLLLWHMLVLRFFTEEAWLLLILTDYRNYFLRCLIISTGIVHFWNIVKEKWKGKLRVFLKMPVNQMDFTHRVRLVHHCHKRRGCTNTIVLFLGNLNNFR